MRNEASSQPAIPIDSPTDARIEAAASRYGADEVVARAIALMAGANAGEDFLLYVGGRHAQGLLDGAPPLYWPELWGARALLHVWNAFSVAFARSSGTRGGQCFASGSSLSTSVRAVASSTRL